MSTGSKVFLVVLVLFAGAAIGGMYVMFTGDGPLAAQDIDEGAVIPVEIPEGMAARDVADLLEAERVIRSATAFRLSIRTDARAGQIKPGSYELVAGMSSDEILDILVAGPPGPDTFRVTLPEGLTVEQSLLRISAAGDYTVEELRAALAGVPLPAWVPAELPAGAEPFEGLLFPETYEFRVDAELQEVLARMVEQTERVVERLDLPVDADPYRILVIGSLIEREARVRDEQTLISAVIHNRLDRDMRLEIDATVLYALGEHRDRVLFADLEVDSPWNTYRNAGLPPTPISGAGEGALRAAAQPADADFLYYVVSDPETGEHAFSRTFEEHQQRVREFRAQRDG